jgi:hypothetical protein
MRPARRGLGARMNGGGGNGVMVRCHTKAWPLNTFFDGGWCFLDAFSECHGPISVRRVKGARPAAGWCSGAAGNHLSQFPRSLIHRQQQPSRIESASLASLRETPQHINKRNLCVRLSGGPKRTRTSKTLLTQGAATANDIL